MTPRIFQVYADTAGKWHWRIRARSSRGKIVGGSQENFDSRSNALRAAHREASFYMPGKARVEVAP